MNMRNKDTKSLYTLSKKTELQVSESILANTRNISSPMAFYGGYPQFNIFYISDIHLDTIMNKIVNPSKCIHDAVKSLYKTMSSEGIIIFSGDISDNCKITVSFYTQFVKYNDFIEYSNTKKKLYNLKNYFLRIDSFKEKRIKRINNLNNYIDQLKSSFISTLDFNNIVRYKKRNYEDYPWETAVKKYLEGSANLVKALTDDDKNRLLLIAKHLDKARDLKIKYDRFLNRCEKYELEIKEIEDSCNKQFMSITASDIYKGHHYLTDNRMVIAVLGNHDYMGFNSIPDSLNYYMPVFKELGIHLLQNDSIEYKNNNKLYIIYGGTGFAKYNDEYNALNLVCCNNFSRKAEIHETNLFEKGYAKTKKIAEAKNACFICISHYPVVDCHAKIDNTVIYFCGHDHRNFYCRNELGIIYADNQIGYNNENISFKKASINGELNPYWFLSDGIYDTSVEEYLQFYRYTGESIGSGTLLRKRCSSADTNMYVIKLNGYYGFFIVNTTTGQSKGISIVNGGKTKKITKSTDIQWLFDNFDIVLSKYLQVLTPLRVVQEKISKELKELGFYGTIHGCIIDIDFYHHIMLNPLDGTMTYYYSSTFGLVRPLSSFENVILSVQKYDNLSHRNYKQIMKLYHKKRMQENYLIGKNDNTYLLGSLDLSNNALSIAEQVVSRSNGMYGVSRKVKSLERLFTGHVLRDFDISLIDNHDR